MKKKTEKKPQGIYRDSHIFFIYECARKGMPGTEIAKALEISYATLNKWFERHPIARMAMKEGKMAKQDKGATFKKYMMNQMSEDQREVWALIEAANINRTGFSLIDEITQGQGERSMQSFYLQALVSSNFNNTKACAMIGIDFKRVESWKEDPAFADMVSEIEQHKKNFFEDAFIDLAAEGHAGAIIHANKTLNADRGYSEKRTITHEGVIGHAHVTMSIEDLMPYLDTKTKRNILGAVTEMKKDRLALNDSSMKQAQAV